MRIKIAYIIFNSRGHTKIHDKSRCLFCTGKQFEENTKMYLLRFSSVIFNRMLISKYATRVKRFYNYWNYTTKLN